MAKKIDASKQGDKFLSSLLGDRVITPLEEKEEKDTFNAESAHKVSETSVSSPVAEIPSKTSVAETPVKVPVVETVQTIYSQPAHYEPDELQSEYIPRRRPGRKTMGDGIKTNISVCIDPTLHKNLKKIAFVNHLKISNIVEEHIAKYVSYHIDDIEAFEKLPEEVKKLAGV